MWFHSLDLSSCCTLSTNRGVRRWLGEDMDPWGVRLGVPILGRMNTLMHIVWLRQKVNSVAAGLTCHGWQRVAVNSITDFFWRGKTMGNKRSLLHTLMHIIWLRHKVNSVAAGPTCHEWQRVAVNSITDYFGRGKTMGNKRSLLLIWLHFIDTLTIKKGGP